MQPEATPAAVRATRPDESGHVAVVTLDRPPVNALVTETYREIAVAFHELAADDEIRVVVFTAAGDRAFCAGADVNEFVDLTPETGPAFQRARAQAFEAVRDSPAVVIGAVNGAALGAGLIFASLCDIVVAARNAVFGLPEVNVGVLGGAKHLSRLVPMPLVRRMTLTGARVDAATLLALGAIAEVVDPGDLMDRAMTLARELVEKEPTTLRLTKLALNTTEDMHLDEAHRVEQAYMLALAGATGAKGRSRDFVAKRPGS